MKSLLARVFLGFASLMALDVHAQAWIPQKGDGFFGANVQLAFPEKHLFDDGTVSGRGEARLTTLLVDGSYAPMRRLAFNANLTYVSGRWDNTAGATHENGLPHGPVRFEYGNTEGALTDLRVIGRYALLSEPLLVTPFLGVTIPVTDYETRGHAALGKGLFEVPAGVFLGRAFEPGLPRLYAQSRLQYAVVEKVEGLNLDRVNADLEVGYDVTDKFSVRVIGLYMKTLGGLRDPQDLLFADGTPDPAKVEIRDQAARASSTKLAVGLSLAPTPKMEWFLTMYTTLAGRNVPDLTTFVFGFSYSPGALPSRSRCRCI